jgi:hypothetical protein
MNTNYIDKFKEYQKKRSDIFHEFEIIFVIILLVNFLLQQSFQFLQPYS